MSDDFEDHCWKDIVPPDMLEIYACYHRKIFVGPRPALLAIDLYEVVYRGGAAPRRPSSPRAIPIPAANTPMRAIEPTKRLFAAARAAGLPIFYSTGDARADKPAELRDRDQAQSSRRSTRRTTPSARSSSRSRSDVVITKQRASVFYGTPLARAPDPARHPDADRLRREHLGLRAGDRGRCLFPRLPRGAGGGVLLRPQHPVAQGQPVRHAPQILRRDARRRGGRAPRRVAR